MTMSTGRPEREADEGERPEQRVLLEREKAAKRHGASADELTEAVRSELAEATKMRMISDVPLGAFLSGGMDSSTQHSAAGKPVLHQRGSDRACQRRVVRPGTEFLPREAYPIHC